MRSRSEWAFKMQLAPENTILLRTTAYMFHLNTTIMRNRAITWITREMAALRTGVIISSSPCSTEFVTVDRQKNTTDSAPSWSISAGFVLSWVKYKRSRSGLARITKPTAHGIAISMLNLDTILILLCICLRLPVCTVATRLGISEAARALDMDRGTLIIVVYWPPNIPRSSAYSTFLNPWAAIMLLNIAVSIKSLIL